METLSLDRLGDEIAELSAHLDAAFTRRASRSIDSPTASLASEDRTAGFCLRSRLHLQCVAIP